MFAVVRFLADFTVDHHFKPSPPAFTRSVVDIAQFFVGKQMSDNPAFKAWLVGLAPLRFSQLDRNTGTVIADFSKLERRFEGRLTGMEGEPMLALQLPATLEGGYWRAPDVLQVAFWKNQRVAVRTTYPGSSAYGGDVDCLALSPDGLLVRFAAAETKPLLVRFRECDE